MGHAFVSSGFWNRELVVRFHDLPNHVVAVLTGQEAAGKQQVQKGARLTQRQLVTIGYVQASRFVVLTSRHRGGIFAPKL